MAAVFYLDPLEFIQKREFEMVVPAFYHPHMPREIIDPPKFRRQRPNLYTKVPTRSVSVGQFRHVEDPNRMQRTAHSIEVMVDMHLKKIEFELVDQTDVVYILDAIDRYWLSRTEYVRNNDQPTIEYLRKMGSFREKVYHHYYRYMKTHPDALDRLYPNDSATGNLLHIMSLTTGSTSEEHQFKLDPLRAKSKPPFEIEDLLPRTAVKEEDDYSGMAAGLGLSTGDLLKDDGKFDFNSFLGGIN